MTIKKVLFKIFKGVLIFIGIILLYLLSAFILSRISISEEENKPDQLDIYILTNGIHSDIVVPVITDQKNWFTEINHLNKNLEASQYKYLAIGWGDKGFYLNTPSWDQLKASTALKAVFGLSGTAVHATYYKSMTESDTCKKISISKEQYARLLKFIDDSLKKGDSDNIMPIVTSATHGNTDGFYEATGRYSLFYTCNTWTNQALKFCGQKACLWTAFQEGIFLKYE